MVGRREVGSGADRGEEGEKDKRQNEKEKVGSSLWGETGWSIREHSCDMQGTVRVGRECILRKWEEIGWEPFPSVLTTRLPLIMTRTPPTYFQEAKEIAGSAFHPCKFL